MRAGQLGDRCQLGKSVGFFGGGFVPGFWCGSVTTPSPGIREPGPEKPAAAQIRQRGRKKKSDPKKKCGQWKGMAPPPGNKNEFLYIY